MENYRLVAARKAAWEWNRAGSHLYNGRKLQRKNQNHQDSLQHLSYLPAIYAE